MEMVYVPHSQHYDYPFYFYLLAVLLGNWYPVQPASWQVWEEDQCNDTDPLPIPDEKKFEL